MSNSRQFCKYIINSSADKWYFLPMAKQRQHLRSLKAANTANQFRATLFAFQMSLFIIDANTLVLLLCPICLVSMHLLTRYYVIQYARLPEWVTRQRNSRVSRFLVSEIYYLIVWVEIRSLFFVNLLGDNRNWIHTQKRSIACLVTYFHCLSPTTEEKSFGNAN